MPHLIPARESAYYPLRARNGRRLRRMFYSLRGAVHLDRIHLPRIHSVLSVLAAVAIPGLAFQLQGPRWIARVIWMTLPVLVLTFMAGLGTFVAELGFGLMIGVHVTSVNHLVRPWLTRGRLVLQAVFGVVLFFAATILVYVPTREWFHREVAMTLTVADRLLIINPRADAASVRRGDVVAYRIDEWSRRGIIVRAGLGVEPVVGVPGDRLVFGNGRVYVNGRVHALPGSLSEWETMVVPERRWFIWPRLDRVNHGMQVSGVDEVIRRLAVVDQSNFVGRPYRWWFFREQGSA